MSISLTPKQKFISNDSFFFYHHVEVLQSYCMIHMFAFIENIYQRNIRRREVEKMVNVSTDFVPVMRESRYKLYIVIFNFHILSMKQIIAWLV